MGVYTIGVLDVWYFFFISFVEGDISHDIFLELCPLRPKMYEEEKNNM